jgi:hypothetical protein
MLSHDCPAYRFGNQLVQAPYWHKLMWRNGTSRGTLMPQPGWETLAKLRNHAPLARDLSLFQRRSGSWRVGDMVGPEY